MESKGIKLKKKLIVFMKTKLLLMWLASERRRKNGYEGN